MTPASLSPSLSACQSRAHASTAPLLTPALPSPNPPTAAGRACSPASPPQHGEGAEGEGARPGGGGPRILAQGVEGKQEQLPVGAPPVVTHKPSGKLLGEGVGGGEQSNHGGAESVHRA